jgi:hypothetical protein
VALKAIVTDLNSVEEPLRALYEQKDDQYILMIDGIEEHPEAKAVKNALDRVRTEKRTIGEKLTKLESRIQGIPDDFDAEAYEELKSKAEGTTNDDTKIAERLERQKATLEAKHARELETERSKTGKLDAQLRRVMVDDGLTKAMIDAGVSREYLAAAKALLKERGQVKMVEEEDGTYQVFADNGIDEKTPLTKFVSDWIGTDEGKVFATKAKGGDAPGGNGRNLGENPWDTQGGKVRPNLTKQQEFIKSNPEKARQLAQAAGVQPNW